jgi:hypothetical protein
VVAVCLFVAASAFADPPVFLSGVSLGNIDTASASEASGIAASRVNSGVLYVHNDSGDITRFFAINLNARLVGTFQLAGVPAIDWEDIAVGPGPVAGQSYVYLGDIGDNNAVRTGGVQVYRVPEPVVPATQSPALNVSLTVAERFTLLYPDGPRDAETLMVDPLTRDLYIISKRETCSRVYRAAAARLVNNCTVMLEYKTSLPWGWATAGDISPDGHEILVRGYSNASLWARPAGTTVWDAFASAGTAVPLASEPQGEAIGFDARGWGYYTTSEGSHPAVYYYDRVPAQIAGDLNCDGKVDSSDIPDFVQALIDPAAYDASHNGASAAACKRSLADMNGDGQTDGNDIEAFTLALAP